MAVLTAERGMLVRAISYALSAARLATAEDLLRPTPCAGWDLRALLHHFSDSLDAFAEAICTGFVGPGPSAGAEGGDAPVPALAERAAALLCACVAAGPGDGRVVVGDRELTTRLVILAGAMEIAVHGWDISVACRGSAALPAGLAGELLCIAPSLVTPGMRPGLFAGPVPVPDEAGPGDRLVAFLGRPPPPATSPP